jgi:hypothetical protein
MADESWDSTLVDHLTPHFWSPPKFAFAYQEV